MDYKFTSLPKLFVDEMIKLYELSYHSSGSVIKSRKMEQIKSTDGTNLYFKRKGGNILCHGDFSKLCQVIAYFPELN